MQHGPLSNARSHRVLRPAQRALAGELRDLRGRAQPRRGQRRAARQPGGGGSDGAQLAEVDLRHHHSLLRVGRHHEDLAGLRPLHAGAA